MARTAGRTLHHARLEALSGRSPKVEVFLYLIVAVELDHSLAYGSVADPGRPGAFPADHRARRPLAGAQPKSICNGSEYSSRPCAVRELSRQVARSRSGMQMNPDLLPSSA